MVPVDSRSHHLTILYHFRESRSCHDFRNSVFALSRTRSSCPVSLLGFPSHDYWQIADFPYPAAAVQPANQLIVMSVDGMLD